MKGAVDFPTWQITQGRQILETTGENISILQDPRQIPPNASVLEVELPDQDSAILQAGRTVQKWTVDLYPWWRRNIAVYSPAVPRSPPSPAAR